MILESTKMVFVMDGKITTKKFALVRELVYLLALEAGICGFESHPGHQVYGD